MKKLRIAALVAPAAMLAGCNTIVLDPAGDVAQQQGDLLVMSTLLMLLIIVPVMALTAFFAWHYRAANKNAEYKPDWDHSTQLELVIWAAPLLIIIALGALTWVGTHLLDPYRPINRIDAQTAVAEDATPLEVEVVALDWKWLFIYPEQGIATVNELVVPTNRPLQFKITGSSVMNSFYVPAMAGQIYAMPGMETRLNAVMNEPSESMGFSANYSGAGFPGMRFPTRSVSEDDFTQWVASVKAGNSKAAADVADAITNGGSLTRAAYIALEKPSENVPSLHYASVDPTLYDAILDMCVTPGKLCMSEQMALDMHADMAGHGEGEAHEEGAGHAVTAKLLTYDKYGREAGIAANEAPDAAHAAEVARLKAKARMGGANPDAAEPEPDTDGDGDAALVNPRN